MVLFGSTTLPAVLTVQRQQPRIKQEVPLPGRSFAYRRDRGGFGAQFVLGGAIRPSSQATRDLIAGLADGTARILDLQEATLTLLESCFRYVAGPTWTDYTAESQSTLGTPFTLLGATTDYGYFGHREKCNQLAFVLAVIGTYGALTWEYSQGNGAWATLTVTDRTSGLHQNGAVTFTPPSDWKQDTVNGVTKFWVRVHAASITTPATIYNIQLNNVFVCIMLNPSFDETADNYNEIPYAVTLLQTENP
ncbi:MAG: hypothetical protein WB661_01705 [Candidatus Bathyarchaeia archaeon]